MKSLLGQWLMIEYLLLVNPKPGFGINYVTILSPQIILAAKMLISWPCLQGMDMVLFDFGIISNRSGPKIKAIKKPIKNQRCIPCNPTDMLKIREGTYKI